MLKLIKKNTSIFFAILLFFGSVTTFAISQASANAMPEDDCHNCGTVSACEDGGQSYGYEDCIYDESSDPPDNCNVVLPYCGDWQEN